MNNVVKKYIKLELTGSGSTWRGSGTLREIDLQREIRTIRCWHRWVVSELRGEKPTRRSRGKKTKKKRQGLSWNPEGPHNVKLAGRTRGWGHCMPSLRWIDTHLSALSQTPWESSFISGGAFWHGQVHHGKNCMNDLGSVCWQEGTHLRNNCREKNGTDDRKIAEWKLVNSSEEGDEQYTAIKRWSLQSNSFWSPRYVFDVHSVPFTLWEV